MFSFLPFLSFSLNPLAAFPCGFFLSSPVPGPLCSENTRQVLISISSVAGTTGITWPQRHTWAPWTTCTYEPLCVRTFQSDRSPLAVTYLGIVCSRALQVLMDLQGQKETWWVSKLGIKKGVGSKNPFPTLSSLPLCHPFCLVKPFSCSIQIQAHLAEKDELSIPEPSVA